MGVFSKSKANNNGQQKKEDPENKEKTGEEKEMSFLEHLEELRWHLMRSIIAILLVGIVLFINIQWFIADVVLAPMQSDFPTNEILSRLRGLDVAESIQVMIIAITPYEQFLRALTVSAIGGFIFSFPYIIWEIWRFIKPGLHNNEKKGLRGNVVVMSLLFFIGISFSYFIITPFALQFFSTFQIMEGVENQWRIGNIIAMITQIAIAGGLIFEMPIIVYYLSKIGLLTPEIMKAYRRHAIVVLLILAAIITPPDWITQILIFIPLTLLYETSIRISAMVARKREAALA
ncbi:MAG: twin-arginine translocase subunit TatC [Bacteroidota bacterium]